MLDGRTEGKWRESLIHIVPRHEVSLDAERYELGARIAPPPFSLDHKAEWLHGCHMPRESTNGAVLARTDTNGTQMAFLFLLWETEKGELWEAQ